MTYIFIFLLAGFAAILLLDRKRNQAERRKLEAQINSLRGELEIAKEKQQRSYDSEIFAEHLCNISLYAQLAEEDTQDAALKEKHQVIRLECQKIFDLLK